MVIKDNRQGELTAGAVPHLATVDLCPSEPGTDTQRDRLRQAARILPRRECAWRARRTEPGMEGIPQPWPRDPDRQVPYTPRRSGTFKLILGGPSSIQRDPGGVPLPNRPVPLRLSDQQAI